MIHPSQIAMVVPGETYQGTLYRHAILWKIVEQLGGINQLADTLRVDHQLVRNWVNLTSCPPATPNHHWTQAALLRLNRQLYTLTGYNLGQLFPAPFRAWVQERRRKRVERQQRKRTGVKNFKYRLPIGKRGLLLNAIPVQSSEPFDLAVNHECRHIIDIILRLLPKPRMVEILVLRYGLDGGRGRTLDELAAHFHITREQIRQEEQRAFRIIESTPQAIELLRRFLPDATCERRKPREIFMPIPQPTPQRLIEIQKRLQEIQTELGEFYVEVKDIPKIASRLSDLTVKCRTTASALEAQAELQKLVPDL